MVKDTENKIQHSLADISILIILPILASVLTWFSSVNLLVSMLLLFGPPALYISWRRKDIILRSTIFALTMTVISILTDYLAERDQSWVSTSSFNFRIAGWVPIEALVWMFLFTYLIVAYFQYFYDHALHASIGKRMRYLFIIASAVLVWLCLTAFINVHFRIDYYYIKLGIVIILLPTLGFVLKFPQYLRTFLKISPYVIGISFLNIIVSLEKGHWSYPGQHYVGWVQLGKYGFPIEELVFWIILGAAFAVAQFEFFDNDRLEIKSK